MADLKNTINNTAALLKALEDSNYNAKPSKLRQGSIHMAPKADGTEYTEAEMDVIYENVRLENEYIKMVVMSDHPDQFSVTDQWFQVLPEQVQRNIIERFDGYGLRNLIEAHKKHKNPLTNEGQRVEADKLPPF